MSPETKDWYPTSVRVGPEGTPGTYEFMQGVFQRDEYFNYVELGVYKADTARNVCELFPNATLFLFDFEHTLEEAREKLGGYANQVHYFSNTQKYNDSYNWQLLNLIKSHQDRTIFDYVFLDGAHTFAIDALSFYLCDRLLNAGGYLDFDDYGWRLRGSSLDPKEIPEISLQYTEEQIDSYQVKLLVDELVRPHPSYVEVLENKVFRKTSNA